MSNRMRDLEQIQERDPEESGRRLGTMVMAALTLVGLSSAIGVVVGRAAQPDAYETTDPLAAVDFGAMGNRGAEGLQEPVRDIRVEAIDLTFPSTLSEKDERPEVLAALEAAAREEAELADEPQAAVVPAPLPEAPSAPAVVPHSLPAAIAAGPASRQLPRAARNDPLVAETMPEHEPVPRADRGEEGEYTLQVISYDSRDQARAFARRLRAKGHKAFVARAEIEGRGVYFRVRIGPFDKRHKARAYRADFEAQEGMNTYIVRRPRGTSR